jgi:hypothetical protein
MQFKELQWPSTAELGNETYGEVSHFCYITRINYLFRHISTYSSLLNCLQSCGPNRTTIFVFTLRGSVGLSQAQSLNSRVRKTAVVWERFDTNASEAADTQETTHALEVVSYAVLTEAIYRGYNLRSEFVPCGGGIEYHHRNRTSRRRRRKGNSVSNETVIYGYGSFATLTSEWCTIQNTDPSSRQRGRPTSRSKYMSD